MQIALIAEEFVNKCDIMTSQNFQGGGLDCEILPGDCWGPT